MKPNSTIARLIIPLLGTLLCLRGFGNNTPYTDSTANPHIRWSKAQLTAPLQLLATNPGILAPEGLPAITSIKTHYGKNYSNQWLTPYQGIAEEYFGAEVQSYQRKNGSASFGRAYFRKRSNQSTKWQLNQHTERIAPYTISDTIGGTQQTDEYLFEGGITRKINSIQLGIKGGYQSSIMWKTVNPRPKSIAAETYAMAGTSIRIKQTSIALGLRYSHYTQDITVSSNSNYSRKDMIYAERGFGIIHESISGMHDNYSRNYKSNVFTANITLHQGEMFNRYLSIEASHEKIQAIESNNIEPFILAKNCIRVNTGASTTINNNTFAVQFDGRYTQTNGTERFYQRVKVTPDSQLYNWELLTQGVMYKAQNQGLGIKLSGLHESASNLRYALALKATYSSNNEQYSQTPNKIECQSILFESNPYISKQLGYYTLTLTANAGYRQILSSSANFTEAIWPRTQDLEKYYSYMHSNTTQWFAQITIHRKFQNNKHIGLSANHGRQYRHGISTQQSNLSIEVLL